MVSAPQPEQVMVAPDFQKAYDSFSFQFLMVALSCIHLPAPYVSLLLSIIEGPILFCVGRRFEPGVELRPRSRIRQGDPLSPLLFNVVTIFLIYDFGRLRCDFWVPFYVDDILICLPGCTRSHEKELQALLCVLNIFGFYSTFRLKYNQTFVVVKRPEGLPQPGSVAGITVKPRVKYRGVLLGNVSGQQAYGPVIAKMMGRAKTLSSLPLGMEEKTNLFCDVDCTCFVVNSAGPRAHGQGLVPTEFDTARGPRVEFLAPPSGYLEHAQKGGEGGACPLAVLRPVGTLPLGRHSGMPPTCL